MATTWFSSKLRAAEEFLQQIDQAAETISKQGPSNLSAPKAYISSSDSAPASIAENPVLERQSYNYQQPLSLNHKVSHAPHLNLQKHENGFQNTKEIISDSHGKEDWTAILAASPASTSSSVGSSIYVSQRGGALHSLNQPYGNGKRLVQSELQPLPRKTSSKISPQKHTQRQPSQLLSVEEGIQKHHGFNKEGKQALDSKTVECDNNQVLDTMSTTNDALSSSRNIEADSSYRQPCHNIADLPFTSLVHKKVDNLEEIDNCNVSAQGGEMTLQERLDDNFSSMERDKTASAEISEKNSPLQINSNEKLPAYVDDMEETTRMAKQKTSDANSDPTEEESDESATVSEYSDSDYEENVKSAEIRAAKIAAALSVVKEQREFVEKMEAEKTQLEALLLERAKEQVEEAAGLRTNMLEIMQAAELEKRRHTSTRMEALAREAKLEAENYELSRALATTQRNLDKQLSEAVDLRNKVESKKYSIAGIERKIKKLGHHLVHPLQAGKEEPLAYSNHIPYEDNLKELRWNIENCQFQASEIQQKITNAKNAMWIPSEREKELENHLTQLTDHLIQKQTQVEALLTEKATLTFRLEALSSSLQEEKALIAQQGRNKVSYGNDVEWGSVNAYSSKSKVYVGTGDSIAPEQLPYKDAFLCGISPILLGMNSLFVAGRQLLRMHKIARVLSGMYFFLLHGWVLFVFFIHSPSPIQVVDRN